MKSMKKCRVTENKISIINKLRNRRRSSAGMFYTSSAGAVTSLILMLLLGALLTNTVFGAEYSINYNDGVIADMPADESGTTSGSVTLSSNTPTSVERRFAGWCLGTSSSSNITTTNGVDSCSSTTYLPGASLPISQGSADNYLYAMWTNLVNVTFNLDAGINSIVVDGTTITQSGTTLALLANRGYEIKVNCKSSYMPNFPVVGSGDTIVSGVNIFVGANNSVINANSQAQRNVNVTFTMGDNMTNIKVNNQTVTPGGSALLLGGNTYTVTVTPEQYYGFNWAKITSGDGFYNISNIDQDNKKFDLTVGISNGTVNVTSCITADTIVTLADGSKKRVADLKGDELLLAWDFDTGSYTAAPITFIDSDPEKEYDIIHTYFMDEKRNETDIEVISEHGFYDYTLNKFIYINSNSPERYIGHEFIMQDGKSYKIVRLVNIKHEKKVTIPYSPTTYQHFNYYTNDMLSMPGGIKGMFNYFEVDKDIMQYDKEKKKADIDKYGLLTLEDFDGMIDELGFEAYQGKYLNISIGKGLITWEDIQKLAERYGHFTEEQTEEKGGENE